MEGGSHLPSRGQAMMGLLWMGMCSCSPIATGRGSTVGKFIGRLVGSLVSFTCSCFKNYSLQASE